MRRFALIREVDITGVSGIGIVAEGVQLSGGTCIIQWLTAISSIGIYESIDHVIFIHGHQGATKVEWVDL